jgi:predicted N-acetyltransferase YhbS
MHAEEEIMTVRPECTGDYAAIGDVNGAAFGQDNEARLVGRLRQLAGFDPGLGHYSGAENGLLGRVSPVAGPDSRATFRRRRQ